MLVLSFGIMWQEYKPDWNAYHGRNGNKIRRKVTRGSLMRIYWVVAAFLMLEFYKSNLKASLTIRSDEPNIHNIQEALDRCRNWGERRECINVQYFPTFCRDMAVHMQDLIVQQFKAFPTKQTLHILRQVMQKGTVIPARYTQLFVAFNSLFHMPIMRLCYNSPKLVSDTQNAVLEKGGVGYFYDELMARGRQMYHQRGEEYPLTFMTQKYCE